MLYETKQIETVTFGKSVIVLLMKSAQKQGLESTKRKKVKNKKMLQMSLFNICDIPKKIWTHFCLFLATFSCLTLTFLALSLKKAL